MKKGVLFCAVLMIAGFCFQLNGQSAEKSSGVVKLDMKKKSTRSRLPAGVSRGRVGPAAG